jgi:hypothetical protein
MIPDGAKRIRHDLPFLDFISQGGIAIIISMALNLFGATQNGD